MAMPAATVIANISTSPEVFAPSPTKPVNAARPLTSPAIVADAMESFGSSGLAEAGGGVTGGATGAVRLPSRWSAAEASSNPPEATFPARPATGVVPVRIAVRIAEAVA